MGLSGGKPDWTVDGRDWPHRDASLFLEAGGLRWHVQRYGRGPVALLLHGTGAATHSVAALGSALARDFTIIAPDLPGHGFTETPRFSGMSLGAMASGVAALLDALDAKVAVAVGHSAGAAILVRMITDNKITPEALVAVNGALAPFEGIGGVVLPVMAKLLSLNPFLPGWFAYSANRRERVEKLIRETGSTIPEANIELYARLFRRPGHVSGALSMMANWDLSDMPSRIAALSVPALFVAGTLDRAVPPETSRTAASLAPHGEFIEAPGAGHLAHEERPDAVADIIRALAQRRCAARNG